MTRFMLYIPGVAGVLTSIGLVLRPKMAAPASEAPLPCGYNIDRLRRRAF